ncbi:60S acidic ribosomal protein family, putative [Theobroma cacao]|uniref:60S acidic ribosomal protein family, putative n=1 Tax=Theobroma cacao TaxID=3641 RepID=A0A061G3F9_THECC|nr:60S acidic ribosomal protein family, putative [Theobroma cacao]
MATSELACSYAALILHDDRIPITAEKIVTLVKTAKVPVESYWPSLFTKLLAKRNIDDIIMNVGSGGDGAPVAAAAASVGTGAGAAAASTPAVEEKKEEDKEETDDDIGFGLFDD